MGQLPDSVQSAIKRQHPDLVSRRPGTIQRRPKPEVENTLPMRNSTLKIWLPDMKLPSVNMMIGSKRRESQPAAKTQAREAIEAYRGPLWRFTARVDIIVHQFYGPAERTMDADNLYAKHLIDMLTKTGIGVIEDDSMKYVHSVKRVVDRDRMTGVELIIEPYNVAHFDYVGDLT